MTRSLGLLGVCTATNLVSSAFMDHQNRRVEDVATRTTTIDLRTTQILTVVEQQQGSTSSQALIQNPPKSSSATQFSVHTMPAPSLLKDLCDKQQLMNSWLRRKRRVPASQIEQILQYCTCRRKPQFLSQRRSYYMSRFSSGLAFATYSLHEETCLLHVDGQRAVGVGGSYTFCNRFLGLSLQVMMSLTKGAGCFAICPTIRIQAVVARDSPAFALLFYPKVLSFAGTELIDHVNAVKTSLFKLFHEGHAAPTDRLEDGSTILHTFCKTFLLDVLRYAPKDHGDLKEFVRELIDFGIPLGERTIYGSTSSDIIIRGLHASQPRSRGPQFEECLKLLDILVSSGEYINSPIRDGSYTSWNYWSSQAARSLLKTNPDAIEFLEIEVAILSRSVESLQHCLMSQNYPCPDNAGYFQLLTLSLGWLDGLVIILESPLGQIAGQCQSWSWLNPIGDCFVQACEVGEIECAVLLMKHLQCVELRHLRAAVRRKEDDLITGIISALVKSRQQLQQLALEHLPHDVLCSLSVPTSGLLDTKASKVYDALEEHNIKAQEPSYGPDSVYSYAEDDIAIFERLYKAGFTDLNQCGGDSMSHLLELYNLNDARDPFDLLKSAEWLVFRGASLYQLSEQGYPSVFSLAYAFGDALPNSDQALTSRSAHDKAHKGLRSPKMTQPSEVINFLCSIIRGDYRGDCLCACSEDGCSSFQQILRGCYEAAFCTDFCPIKIAAMIDGLQGDAPGQLSETESLDVAHRTLRYITFDALQLTHTCHKNKNYLDFWGQHFKRMDDEEVQEIREEEAALISQLDQLVEEFGRKYDELGLSLNEFIEKYWERRMDKILGREEYAEEDSEEDIALEEVPEDGVDSEYEERVRELGVILT
ncbi:hypothetical protein BJX64DRAFT_206586 [Aspergillus heterothallicus]